MIILQLISILVALLLGAIVVTRDASDRNRWLLLFFNVTVAFWITASIFADIPGDFGLLWNRLVFLGGILTCFGGYVLIASLGNRLNRYAGVTTILFLIWAAVIILTPFVVADTQVRFDDAQQGLNAIRGPGYGLYIISILVAGLGDVVFAFYLMRHAKGRFRSQLGIIFAGFVAMLVVGVLTGVVLPLLVGNSAPANFAFLSAFIAIGVFTYAIVQQRLFDIRLAIARSLGYFLALAAIVVFYAVGIFGVAGILFSEQVGAVAQTYYVASALVVALTFGPLNRFFSRVTSRIFFRDTYETEEVFSKLTSSLVGTVDLEALTSLATRILQDAVKVQSLEMVTVKGAGKYSDLFGSFKALNQQLVVTDELSLRHKRVAERLNEANISLIARLQTHQEIVGYIVCGPKIRGDALTSQDIELMRVASGELAVAVQNALRFEEISHFNEKLKQEIEEATAQLRDSNRKLKKLDEAKDEFISMASHQLRTPLTSVKGYISMVMDGDAGKLTGPQQKLLEEAFIAAQRMVYLIGDFLNVSRLQTGRFMLERKRTDIAQVVNDEVAQLTSTAARRQITVQYHHPVQFPIVSVDENKIRQVIMNFIDNAIFYSRPNTVVDVLLVNTGREIRFEVHDSGIGVPQADRHKVFTKFFRAENARRIRPDGTGIGLFMAKKVITAHGGSMIFETKEHKGSTFGFVLPLAALKHQPEQLNH